jgi:carboxymethylenebutenolidase
MCDEQMLEGWAEYLKEHPPISRRRFGTLSAGAGLAAVLPPVANAQAVAESDVEVRTPDGVADCYFVHPSSGTHPGVIVWPDILGLRPAFRSMGRRLAQSGYSVLVVNPFYRGARAPVVAEGASFNDPEVRNTVFPLAQALNAETHVTDAIAFVDFLDEQDAVAGDRQMGTTGYCMGGPMVMRTAAARADRIGAAATFHGGGLATADNPQSPHLLVPQMSAQFLIAIAASDDDSDPNAKVLLREAFDSAGLMAEVEVYQGTQHGWCPPDSAVYSEADAERAWSRLLVLFDRALA